GLPGNPVSAMVTFLLFVRPSLLVMSGVEPSASRTSAVLDERYEKRPGRAHAVRVRLEPREDGWHALPTKEQGSHVLTSMLGADLALVPPVSGGDGIHVRVGAEPLSLEGLSRAVAGPSAGAVVTFQGMPRDVPELDYEAYVEMAAERIEAILEDCVERHGLVA